MSGFKTKHGFRSEMSVEAKDMTKQLAVLWNADESAYEVFDLEENKSYGLFDERRDAVEALNDLRR